MKIRFAEFKDAVRLGNMERTLVDERANMDLKGEWLHIELKRQDKEDRHFLVPSSNIKYVQPTAESVRNTRNSNSTRKS